MYIRHQSRNWLRLMVAVLFAFAALGWILGMGGCARTAIDTPIGSYTSDKDFALEGFEFEKRPDGTIKGKIGKLTNTASSVINQQAAIIDKLVDKIPGP